MEIKQKWNEWNKTQKELREILEQGFDPQKGLKLIIPHHAVLHSGQAFPESEWSYEDLIFEDLSEDDARTIPPKFDHSIVWNIWHLARIEDITMNILIADDPQLFNQNNWKKKLNVQNDDCGFAHQVDDVQSLSKSIDITALRDYRAEVGKKTREILINIKPDEVGNKIIPARINRARDEGAVILEGEGLLEYWGNRTVAGILLMPPTRHSMVHLNESMEIKEKLN